MHILLVEDEDAAARRLEKMVRSILPQATLHGPLESVTDTLQWLHDHDLPDLLLLDIHLADGSSFELFDKMDIRCPIIFITAYDEYAIRAFRVNAVDYLLKPVKHSELSQSLHKISQQQKATPVDYGQLAEVILQQNTHRRYLVKIGRQIRLIETEEIAYAYTDAKITFLVTRDGRRFPVDYSLEKMEEMLPPRQYFRINRQFIIGIHSISEMLVYSKSRVKLLLNPPLDTNTIVSTERSPHFKNWLVGEV